MSSSKVTTHLSAYAGGEITVRWRGSSEEPARLVVSRLTSTRAVKRAEQALEFDGGEAMWSWEIPAIRGRARYRVALDTDPGCVLMITAHDRREHDKLRQVLRRETFRHSELPADSVRALQAMGIRTRPEQRTGDPRLTLSSEEAGNRTLIFRDQPDGRTVWIAGPEHARTGSWKIIAPLSLIDPDVLGTDEGRIRLYSLLTDQPDNAAIQ